MPPKFLACTLVENNINIIYTIIHYHNAQYYKSRITVVPIIYIKLTCTNKYYQTSYLKEIILHAYLSTFIVKKQKNY